MKLSILGLGRVGAALAHLVVLRGLADELVLVTRDRERAHGEALDLTHALSFVERRCRVRAGDMDDTAGSDIVVLAASAPMTEASEDRAAAAEANAALVRELAPAAVDRSPGAVVIVITNPVDALTWVALRCTGLPAERVIGTGTLIDSARFRTMLSAELGVHPDDLRAYILGEHGPAAFPALSAALMGGVRIEDGALVRGVFERTVRAGHEIVRRKGHTSYAVAGAAGLIIDAIVHDSRRTIPVSVRIDEWCGARDVCLSLPCVIGRGGIERVLRPAFNEAERAAWVRSAEVVRGVIERVGG